MLIEEVKNMADFRRIVLTYIDAPYDITNAEFDELHEHNGTWRGILVEVVQEIEAQLTKLRQQIDEHNRLQDALHPASNVKEHHQWLTAKKHERAMLIERLAAVRYNLREAHAFNRDPSKRAYEVQAMRVELQLERLLKSNERIEARLAALFEGEE